MLSADVDCDCWPSRIFHGWLDYMKLWDMQSGNKVLWCWIHKKGHRLKYLYLQFYTMNMVYAAKYHPCCPHTCICICGGRECANACCGMPLSELPISRFFDRATISIFCAEKLSVWCQLSGRVGQWVATVSYSIGIVGTVRLWGKQTRKIEICSSPNTQATSKWRRFWCFS